MHFVTNVEREEERVRESERAYIAGERAVSTSVAFANSNYRKLLENTKAKGAATAATAVAAIIEKRDNETQLY